MSTSNTHTSSKTGSSWGGATHAEPTCGREFIKTQNVATGITLSSRQKLLMIAQLLQSQSCAHDASKNGANAALSFHAFTRSLLPRSSAHFAPVCLCVLVRDTLQAWCAVRRMQGAAGQGHVRMRRGGGQPVVGAQLAGEQEEGRLLPRHSSVTLPYKDFPASRRLRQRRGCAIHRRRGWSWCAPCGVVCSLACLALPDYDPAPHEFTGHEMGVSVGMPRWRGSKEVGAR